MPQLIVVSAPSGAGKTTICRRLVEKVGGLAYSVSYTTRKPRPKEKEGVDYFFCDRPRFDAMIEAGEFLEWAEVFGNYYGTSRQWVLKQLENGLDVLVDIEIAGARQIKNTFPEAVFIFIVPPTFEELVHRLELRGTEGESELRQRLEQARTEIEAHKMYDYLVINDDLDRAVQDLVTVVQAERLRLPKSDQFWRRFF
ncbi:MAG: guanylate kinase [Deltaproteobacteria bacterium]|nr:guanylate kinase [Deltaproteobacteria bacterium]MBW2139777.1 guanylate kinase [Deltaproteobacteria bacterium]